MARRLLLWALLLLTTAVGSLSADEWRVAIVAMSPRSELILEQTYRTALQWAGRLVATPKRLEERTRRQEQAEQEAADRALHARYASGDGKAPAGKDETPAASAQVPDHITYTTVSYTPTLTRLLRSGDDAVRWYREREGLDGLLLIDVQSLDDFERVVYTAVEGERTTLLDRLVTKGAFHELADDLGAALLSYSGAHTLAALLVAGGPLSLSIRLDGVEQKAGERLFILNAAPVSLTLSAPSYREQQQTVSLAPDAVTTIEAALTPIEEGPITVRSKSGSVDWFVDGQKQGTGLSLTIEHPTFPLSLLAAKEGFASREIGLVQAPGEELAITMEGRGSLSSAVLDREQQDFYKQLRKTILLFAAYVATIALSNTTALAHPFWQVGQVASGAVAMVNAVALAAQLAAYAR